MAWGHPQLDLCHFGQDSAAVKNTTPPLQPSAEAPLKGKPCRECYCTRRNFSRQDLLSPGPSGSNNPLEDAPFLSSSRGTQTSPYNRAEAIGTFKSRAYSDEHRDTYKLILRIRATHSNQAKGTTLFRSLALELSLLWHKLVTPPSKDKVTLKQGSGCCSFITYGSQASL